MCTGAGDLNVCTCPRADAFSGVYMTVKNIVFLTTKQLENIVNVKVKKSHIYEIFAAAFGFNSYAALGNRMIFIECDTPLTIRVADEFQIRTRCIELGYTESVASSISAQLPIIIRDERLAILNLNDLIAALRSDIDDFDGNPIWVDADDFNGNTKWVVGDWQLSEIIRNSPSTLKSLDDSANSGNGLAHYALALIYLDNKWGEEDQISDYWFRQQQAGQSLGAVELEFANNYAEQLVAKEKSKHHLTESALLNNEMALVDLAEYFDDPLFFDRKTLIKNTDPMKIAMIAERLHRIEDAHHWLIVAAEAGNPQAMRELITYFEKHDLIRCWTWIYLSKLVNYDLTEDRYFAMHENGYAYDDIGGPLEIGGEGGVDLPKLDEFQDQIAKRNSEELFRKIELSMMMD